MTAENHSQLANFIWSICNLLRGPYKRNEYCKVILPLTVLRRFDCLLEPTKARVLAEHPKIKAKPETVVRREHWDVQRGRFCMRVNPPSDGLRRLSPQDEISFVPMEAIGEYGGLCLDQIRATSDMGQGYTEFDHGDILVAKITPCFENGKGALATDLLNGVAFGTTELHVLRSAPNLEPHFLFYFTVTRLFRGNGEGEMYGAGGQKRVPSDFCKNIQVPLPNMEEQRVIVDFLDRETAKIDALLTKKRTLIERLKEKRAAFSLSIVRGRLPTKRLSFEIVFWRRGSGRKRRPSLRLVWTELPWIRRSTFL